MICVARYRTVLSFAHRKGSSASRMEDVVRLVASADSRYTVRNLITRLPATSDLLTSRRRKTDCLMCASKLGVFSSRCRRFAKVLCPTRERCASEKISPIDILPDRSVTVLARLPPQVVDGYLQSKTGLFTWPGLQPIRFQPRRLYSGIRNYIDPMICWPP